MVRRATDRRTGREVAVKIISKRSANDSQNELSILRTLRHPNIMEFIDVFQDATTVYIISEL
jgi:serine/threonine protein kinase